MDPLVNTDTALRRRVSWDRLVKPVAYHVSVQRGVGPFFVSVNATRELTRRGRWLLDSATVLGLLALLATFVVPYLLAVQIFDPQEVARDETWPIQLLVAVGAAVMLAGFILNHIVSPLRDVNPGTSSQASMDPEAAAVVTTFVDRVVPDRRRTGDSAELTADQAQVLWEFVDAYDGFEQVKRSANRAYQAATNGTLVSRKQLNAAAKAWTREIEPALSRLRAACHAATYGTRRGRR